MDQYGGEGASSYKGNSNNSSLAQQGGEGAAAYNKTGGDSSLLNASSEYCGPGRFVGKNSEKY